MERPDQWISTIKRVRRIVWNWWTTKRARVKYFPGFTLIEILRQIQKDLKTRQINPEQVEGIILFMSVSNDMGWTKNGNSAECVSNSKQVSDYAKEFPRGHWSFLGPGNEEKWFGTYAHKPEGKWHQQANQMIDQFQQSGHPIFRGTHALDRVVLMRGWGRNTIHFREHWIDATHHSLSKSAQCLRSSVEMVHRLGWKDAWSDIYGCGPIHFWRKWSAHKTAGSWFLGRQPAKDRRSRGKLSARSLATVRNDESRWTTSHRMWRIRIHKNSLYSEDCITEPVRTWMMDMEIESHHAENTRYLGLIEILRSNFGYKGIQRSVQFVMSKSSVILIFIMDSRFKSPLHLETTPMFGGHIQRPRSLRGWVTLQRSRKFSLKSWSWMHAGHGSRATDHSIGNVRWLHSDSWTEMERHHCQWIQSQIQVRISDLESRQ